MVVDARGNKWLAADYYRKVLAIRPLPLSAITSILTDRERNRSSTVGLIARSDPPPPVLIRSGLAGSDFILLSGDQLCAVEYLQLRPERGLLATSPPPSGAGRPIPRRAAVPIREKWPTLS